MRCGILFVALVEKSILIQKLFRNVRPKDYGSIQRAEKIHCLNANLDKVYSSRKDTYSWEQVPRMLAMIGVVMSLLTKGHLSNKKELVGKGTFRETRQLLLSVMIICKRVMV